MAGLLPRRIIGRLLAADVLPIAPNYIAGRRDLWLLRRAEKIVVSGRAEFDLARRLGFSEPCLALLQPGIPDSSAETLAPDPIATGRYLLCVGPLERSKGTQDAIWTLEILKYVFEDLQLVIAGDGPDRERLEDFARAIEATQVVHFVGVRPNLASLYAGAAAVWVPSQTDRGARVALEAMQAGRPVVASSWPRLAEIVIDGETGFLTPAGDKVALAKQTRKLLDDPQLAEQMGQAGRRRVAEHFSFERYMTNLQRLLN
jgi:glycosyltransferase involved in cell wall biosynthesis